MVRTLRPLSIALLLSSPSLAAVDDPVATLDDGRFAVTVNSAGVLIEAPAPGLRTTYGPARHLSGPVSEWRAVIYRDARGLQQSVLSGTSPDPYARPEAERVEFVSTPTMARALTRTADFEFVTETRFDPCEPELIVLWSIENVSGEELRDVIFTYEWRVQDGEGGTYPSDLEGALPPSRSDLARVGWMTDNLVPGQKTALTFCYRQDADAGLRIDEVPLVLYTDAKWPNGLTIGDTNGVSWGDYDLDGWPDFFAADSVELWRNQQGTGWRRLRDLQNIIDPSILRYGSSFGDYDNDGLADIGTEPRGNGNQGMNLAHNLGGGPNFDEVADDPAVVDVRPEGAAETLCWADVDFDGHLDAFVPVYPPSSGGPGNFFLHNLGPVLPGGEHAFHESSAEDGLDNPGGTARPEGAQFVDLDDDGDLDLYSNGTYYQNHSTFGDPDFRPLGEAASGIQFSADYDEGCAFFDYDMDGDYDLLIAYCAGGHGVRLFEAYGDGMYDLKRQDIIDSPNSGLCLGFSVADWDNDGDLDFSTKEVFRRNQWMETGDRHFTVATHSIPAAHLTSATPAWADFDHDGDLDGLIGNWLDVGHLYENVLYDENTPDDERRYVRVRVMRDSDVVPGGIETEYGANVELFLEGEEYRTHRRQQVASSHGYLNQNEYVLHYALPADPFPDDDTQDLHFDLAVDFVSDPALGLRRVDRQVNPVLSRLPLADLRDREITVFRSGAVVVNGCRFEPVAGNEATLMTSTGGLGLAAPKVPLPDPSPAPSSDWYVGLDFDTNLAVGPLQLKEVILDGTPDESGPDCGSGVFEVVLWDVTVPGAPVLVPGVEVDAKQSVRNRRHSYRTSAKLLPQHHYRVAARVSGLRATGIAAPVVDGLLTVNGGLSYQDLSPCTGVGVESAAVDTTSVFLAIRAAVDQGDLWADLGYALDGTAGTPSLAGSGDLVDGNTVHLRFANGPASRTVLLILGTEAACAPFSGGTLVPLPQFVNAVRTDASGAFDLSANWVGGSLGGDHLYAQVWFLDPAGPKGLSASNALSGTEPY